MSTVRTNQETNDGAYDSIDGVYDSYNNAEFPPSSSPSAPSPVHEYEFVAHCTTDCT